MERMRRERGVEEGKWSNGTSGRAEAESKRGVRSTRVSVPDVRMYAATHGNSCNTNTRNSLCVARDEHGTSRTANTGITISQTQQSHRHNSITGITDITQTPARSPLLVHHHFIASSSVHSYTHHKDNHKYKYKCKVSHNHNHDYDHNHNNNNNNYGVKQKHRCVHK